MSARGIGEVPPGRFVVHDADANIDVAIEGVLAVARREILLLAAALQSNHRIMSLVAAGRLRWSLSCAHDFAARSPFALSRMRTRLAEVEEAARRWLPEITAVVEDPAHLRQVLTALSDPYLGQRTVCANDTLIAGLDLDNLPLAGVKLRGATIAQVSARRARLDDGDATGAVITRSCFDTASLRLCALNDAEIQECTFACANLEGAQWRGARLSRVAGRGALLFHSNLEAAHFLDCDFRDADFQGFLDSGTAGAEFVRCDLRRTNWHGRDLSRVAFIHCKLHGAFGAVTGLEMAQIVDADLSPDGDGSFIASRDEVVRRWMFIGAN